MVSKGRVEAVLNRDGIKIDPPVFFFLFYTTCTDYLLPVGPAPI